MTGERSLNLVSKCVRDPISPETRKNGLRNFLTISSTFSHASLFLRRYFAAHSPSSAKGKTNGSHSKFNALPDFIISRTPSGWTNKAVIVHDVEWLSRLYRGESLFLVFDNYKTHCK
jgi:hypothetical protein